MVGAIITTLILLFVAATELSQSTFMFPGAHQQLRP